MDWMGITVLTTTAGADMVSQVLIDAGTLGTMIEDKNDVAITSVPKASGISSMKPSPSASATT